MEKSLSNRDLNFPDGRPVIAISGPNFSGRTRLLRRFCDFNHRKHIYIGPDVYNSLSGLTSTVRQELELHGSDLARISPILSVLGIEQILDQHPGTLSGGEQACLAVLCGMALSPDAMAIDCALEQLDSERLVNILNLLITQPPPNGTLIADNRLHEWPVTLQTVSVNATSPEAPTRPPIAQIEPRFLADIIRVEAPSIVSEELYAGYRGKPNVLRRLNFTLMPGIYSLYGSNGSGKSTLAKVLSGVMRPSAGRILVDNVHARPWRRPGRTMVYGLQNPDVSLFETTVLNELSVGAGKGSSANNRVKAMAKAFGLEKILSANPLSLPFPIRKRISLAATLACPAPWYFLDEPTLGADADTTARLANLIRAIVCAGHGVVVVSHSSSFHRQLNGLSLQLRDGHVLENH